jgi:hypothetical protein
VVLNDDGRFTYTPAAGYTGTDAFVFGFTDGIALGLAVAWIVVHNTAPEAVNDEYYVLAGSAVRGNVLANDTDADGDSLRVVKINDQPLRQLMRLPSGAQLVMNPNGDFVYYAVEQQGAPHTGDDSFTYTVSDGVAEATQTVVVHTAKILGIRSVTFSGGHTVYRDPELDPTGAIAPDEAYSSEHWLDTNLDGDAEDAGKHSWPYAYTRGTTLKVSARFVLDTAWGGGPIYVMATGPADPATGFQIHVGPKAVRVDPTNPTELVLDETESPVAFPNVVQAYAGANLFTLDWQATSDSQRASSTWTKAGERNQTKNPLYLTYDAPDLSNSTSDTVNLYHTLVHLGSVAASGQDTQDGVVQKVWEEFNDLVVRKFRGEYLHYYKSFRTENIRTRQLLAFRDGQCGSWAKLFLDVLKAQGIRFTENYVIAVPAAMTLGIPDTYICGFLVKDWKFNDAGGVAGNAVKRDPGTEIDRLITTHEFKWLNVISLDPSSDPWPRVAAAGNQYEWIYGGDVQDEVGVRGQGVQNPASLFVNHQFVQVRLGGVTKWLDPSYGLEYEGATDDDRLLDFDNKAIAGYFVIVWATVKEAKLGMMGVDLNGDGDTADEVDAWVLLAKPNQPGNQLLKSTTTY